MEELEKENLETQSVEESVKEEPIAEQRPSTKYGRTAYQQQLKEEQEAAQKIAQEAQVNAYWEHEQAYQDYQQNVWANQNTSGSYVEKEPAVKKKYAIILMILIAISTIIAFATNIMAAEAYEMGNTLEEVMDAILVIASQSEYGILITISDTIFFVMIAFFILDILQIKKAGKKTKGAILFAIFLRPAYFVWRAHLLGEKKTIPIIYMLSLYGITFTELYIVMQGVMEMVMRMMY